VWQPGEPASGVFKIIFYNGGVPTRRINYRVLSYALFSALLLLVLLTFRHYGVSWDEGVHDKIGSDLLSYYLGLLHGFVDFQTLDVGSRVAYGGVFNLLIGVAQKFSPLERFDTRHLVNALVGLLESWAAGRLPGSSPEKEPLSGQRSCWRSSRVTTDTSTSTRKIFPSQPGISGRCIISCGRRANSLTFHGPR
jgi:hypothetical protein